MSAERPEVGDVFKSPFATYRIISKKGDAFFRCLVWEGEEIFETRSVSLLFLLQRVYCGASKYSINDLFEVKDEL